MSSLRRFSGCALLTIAVLAVQLLGQPPSRAQEQPGDAYALAVERAVTEFGQGHWEEAYALFRRAHELNPNARTWRGLGLSAFELRQYVEAAASFEAALIDTRKPLSPELREQVKGLIERAREFVSVYDLRLSPPDAEVVVDGRSAMSKGGQLHLDPGRHVVIVRSPGYEERQIELRAGAGTTEDLSIELHALPGRAQASDQGLASLSSRALNPEDERTPRRRRAWTWSFAGAAVAGAAVATGLRLRVEGLAHEHRDCVARAGDCDDIKARGMSLLKGSYVAGGLSGAFFVSAVVAFFVEEERPSPRAATAKLAITERGVQVVGTF